MTDSQVTFSREAAKAAVSRQTYTLGLHYGVVTDVKFAESKGDKPDMPGIKYKMLITTHKPLRDHSDAASGVGTGIKRWQCLPFWDEAWDDQDEEIQKRLKANMGYFTSGLHELLSSLLAADETNMIPASPQKQEDGSYLYLGEPIDKSEYSARKMQACEAAGELAARMWNEKDPSPIIDRASFFTFGFEPAKPGKPAAEQPSIRRFFAEHPIDYKTGQLIPLIEAANIMASGTVDEDEDKPAVKATSKSNGRPVAKANGKAVAAKKNGKK